MMRKSQQISQAVHAWVIYAGGLAFIAGVLPAQEARVASSTAEIRSVNQPAAPQLANALKEGLRALGDGLPQAAAYKLRAFLQSSPPLDQRREGALALARALLAARDAKGASESLRAENLPESDAPMRFWRASAESALGHWPEALADFQAAIGDPTVEAEARFGVAEALRASGRMNEAEKAFEQIAAHPRLGVLAQLRLAAIALDGGRLKVAAELLNSSGLRPAPLETPGESQQRAELLGRLRLLQNQPVQAEQIFLSALARPEGMSEQMMVNHYQGWARACLAQHDPGKAEDALESFLDHYPGSVYLPKMLTWLEQLYAVDPSPDDLADLRRWADDDKEPGRQSLATLALSRGELRSGRPERAERILLRFSKAFPEHPLRSRAWMELANLRLTGGRTEEARQALAQARSLAEAGSNQISGEDIDGLDARISLAEGGNADAARKFQTIAARVGGGPQAEAAAFNAVLGWMRAADASQAAAAENDFAARFPNSRIKEEFPLEEGLAEAARSSAEDATSRQRAAASLRRFLQDSPLHPRAIEARIALAELAFMRPRPNFSMAWRELAPLGLVQVQNTAVGGPANSDPQSDRAEYLAIWLLDAPDASRDEDKAVARAKQFLERRADSPLSAEVRMKLCEIYFRKGDYSDAQTQLELLVEKLPSSPLAEQANYLAGLAAARSMNPAGLDKAVKLFEDAARRNGPLKLSARLRQAEVHNQLRRGTDALTLYEDVLSATAESNLPDAKLEARCAALAGKGQTLMDLAASDAKLYGEAARTFGELANTPGASLPWRRQALTKKGRALEKTGDAAAALSAYLEAVDAERAPSESQEPEWTWFYRAGSDAARLLEAQADWAGAVAIYQKLAAADGILKNEFETLKKSRQLEHFIWSD